MIRRTSLTPWICFRIHLNTQIWLLRIINYTNKCIIMRKLLYRFTNNILLKTIFYIIFFTTNNKLCSHAKFTKPAYNGLSLFYKYYFSNRHNLKSILPIWGFTLVLFKKAINTIYLPNLSAFPSIFKLERYILKRYTRGFSYNYANYQARRAIKYTKTQLMRLQTINKYSNSRSLKYTKYLSLFN
jgi:hypothetical protein